MIKDLLSPYKNFLSDHTELRAQVNTSRAVAILGGNLVSNARSAESRLRGRFYKNGG